MGRFREDFARPYTKVRERVRGSVWAQLRDAGTARRNASARKQRAHLESLDLQLRHLLLKLVHNRHHVIAVLPCG